MRLTRYTDFAMRILLCLGAHPAKVWPIAEIARAYGVSQHHLVKVAHDLVKAGYVEGVRGRAGGIRLARPVDEIVVGEVVRRMEHGFELVECRSCLIAPACGLSGVIDEALAAFMAVLDRYTLADLLKKSSRLVGLFDLASPAERRTRPPLSASFPFGRDGTKQPATVEGCHAPSNDVDGPAERSAQRVRGRQGG